MFVHNQSYMRVFPDPARVRIAGGILKQTYKYDNL
jgi:hypothetical protein